MWPARTCSMMASSAVVAAGPAPDRAACSILKVAVPTGASGRYYSPPERRLPGIRDDCGLRAEFFVLQIANRELHAERTAGKVECVVAVGENREPEVADLLPNGGEEREQVLLARPIAADLGHRFALAADDGEVALVDPEQTIEEAHSLQELPRADLENPAGDAVDGF